MQYFDQELKIIHHFNTLPKASLEQLQSNLSLCMRLPELSYCSRHYKGRGNGDISVAELLFLDRLACPEHTALSKIAVREMTTDDVYIAATYKDFVDKMGALGKDPEKPYTLQDLASLACRYMNRLMGTSQTAHVGIRQNAAAYAAAGYYALDGQQDVVLLHPLPVTLFDRAHYADSLVLLVPTQEMDQQAYTAALLSLLSDQEIGKSVHCLCDCTCQSIAHAVLSICGGAVINAAKMPKDMQHVQALTQPLFANLLSLSQKALATLLSKAQELGLDAYEIGIADDAGYLLVKHGKVTLFSGNVSYLRSICFVRSYALQIEPDSYYRALLGAAEAYCSAIAQGKAKNQLAIYAHLPCKQQSAQQTYAQALGALLGIHRFCMEAALPAHSTVSFAQDPTDMLITAYAPDSGAMPNALQGKGNVYLLSPLYDEHGLPDFADLYRMCDYLAHMIAQGKIKSARALCGKTPLAVLAEMSEGACSVLFNPAHADKMDRVFPAAILVEAEGEIAGELIAASLLKAAPEKQSAD